jgi:hypothetical protein
MGNAVRAIRGIKKFPGNIERFHGKKARKSGSETRVQRLGMVPIFEFLTRITEGEG